MPLILLLVCPVTIAAAAFPPKGGQLDGDAINAARFGLDAGALIIKTEMLLDRLGYSPGVIDGRDIAEFQARHQIESTGKLDRETYERLVSLSPDPVVSARCLDADPAKKVVPLDRSLRRTRV